jgi:Flp pilus assembly protein TadG
MDERAPLPRQRSEGPSLRSSRVRHLVRSERGTAVVEFALIAPLLFLVLFGVLEFGRILNAYNQVTQLAGQGARAAAVSFNPDGTAVGDSSGVAGGACSSAGTHSIQCQLSSYYAGNDSLSGVNACIPALPSGIGQPVTVHVTYRYNFITGLFGFAHITLSATQTERAEAPAGYTAGDQSGATCS